MSLANASLDTSKTRIICVIWRQTEYKKRQFPNTLAAS
jgi:hypothetical protein